MPSVPLDGPALRPDGDEPSDSDAGLQWSVRATRSTVLLLDRISLSPGLNSPPHASLDPFPGRAGWEVT